MFGLNNKNLNLCTSHTLSALNTLIHALEFELEDFDEAEAKSLLMLVWEMNTSKKMKDSNFKASRLLNSPGVICLYLLTCQGHQHGSKVRHKPDSGAAGGTYCSSQLLGH